MQKIIQELMITQLLCSDHHNIIKIYQVGKNQSSSEDTIMIVEEYIDFKFYHNLYPSFDPIDVKYYAYELLRTINYMHSKGVIHQSIKASSIPIDPKLNKLRLKNWRNAIIMINNHDHHHHPNIKSSSYMKPSELTHMNNQKSNYFKSPEMLLGYSNISYSTDIWSFGCLLAGWLFRKNVFFKMQEEDKRKGGQIYAVAKVCGLR